MHKFLFYNKVIIFFYMFRALLCSSPGGQIVLYSIWYRHTETSEWSKITKIQFYKYEHMAVKFMYEFFAYSVYSQEIYSNHTRKIHTQILLLYAHIYRIVF